MNLKELPKRRFSLPLHWNVLKSMYEGHIQYFTSIFREILSSLMLVFFYPIEEIL
jgi:hypothetical protein